MIVKKFRCISKKYECTKYKNTLIRPYMEGIIYPNGIVIIGTDIWRLLDKSDYPSYETQTFVDIKELKEIYYIVNKNGSIIKN